VVGPTAGDLFARHHRDVHRYLVRMTGRADVADDLTQEVFLRVVRALRDGGPVGHERGWVFSIAHNLLIDRFRHVERHPVVAAARATEPARSPTQDLVVELSRAIGRLAEADRDLFLLREIGGLSYVEMAATCECTVEAVRSRLHRARAALREMLTGSGRCSPIRTL
jgi:RNA polymerase sigma-70 factor (ECF subfamily)